MHFLKVLTGIIFSLVCLMVPAYAVPMSELKGLVINLPSRTIEYYVDNKLVREYPIAIGKPGTPTPLGEYTVIDKEINPYWYPPEAPGYFVTSGPYNPLGYRWMGFAGNYGIHGTNDPWSIGSAVSNGCIRMYEEDVEKLFAMVEYGTPVRVTYDRIKLRVENDGWVSMRLYPDVYGNQDVSLTGLKALLSKVGLGGWIEDEVLQNFLMHGSERYQRLGQIYNIKVNKQSLQEKAVGFGDTIYIPINAVAGVLQNHLLWDNEQQTIKWKGRTVKGMAKEKNIYVAFENVSKIFGGRQLLDRENNMLELLFPCMLFEGQIVTNEMQTTAEDIAVPAMSLAKALGQKVTWDSKAKVLKLGCKKVPVQVIEGEPYVQTVHIAEYFNAATVWDEKEQTAQLLYPVHPIDYSMYIELMADFRD